MKTMRLRTAVPILVALGVGVSMVFAGSGASKAVPMSATSFQSNGDLISGWYWIRSSGQSATYTFNTSALQTAKSGSVNLNVSALVTNGVNGGSGYATMLKLTVSNGLKTGTIFVPLTNPFRPIDPENSGGVGYQTYGHAYVSSSFLKGAQALTLTYSLPTPTSGAHTIYHVALNQGAMTMAYSVPAL